MITIQRVPTIEEAEAIYYDEINAFELLCEIQAWLGVVCQKDFDCGWNAFCDSISYDSLVNTAQRMGYAAAADNYDEDCRLDSEMRREMIERY